MASLVDILAGAGNLLDLPGSSLRDILSGRNPFDQWTTPFSDVNRASGRDVLEPFLGANEETGMSGWMDNPMEGFKDIAGFGAEMLLDPLNLVPLGAVGKALKGRKAARSANAAMKAERGGKYAMVNPKVAGRAEPFVDTQYELIQAVENNGVVPGYHASKNRISEFSDEYLGSNSAKATGIYSADAKLGHQFVPDPEMLRQYPNRSKLLGDNTHVADVDMGRTAVINIHKLKSGFSTPESVAKLKQYLTDSGFNSVRLVGGGEGRLTQNTIVPLTSSQIKVQGIENPMRLLGYTPAPENPMFPGVEIMHHGGRDMSASATKEHPYGVFDLGRLKTGDGNNMYSPGAYKADAASTSANYRDMVQKDITNNSTQTPMYQLRNVIDDFTDGMSEEVDVATLRKFFQDEADNPIMAKAGELFDIIDKNDYFGADKNDLFFWEELQDAMSSKTGLQKYLGNQDAVSSLANYTTDRYAGQARLYGFDAPAGTKDRFLKWENPMSEQPQAVQDLIRDPSRFFNPEQLDLMSQAREANLRWTQAIDKLKEIEAYSRGQNYMDALRETQYAQHDYTVLKNKLLDQNVPYDIATGRFKDLSEMDGEAAVELLLGAKPSEASLADTVTMRNAGIPGVKNLANSTGQSTYNYAIWDQNLLNKMRIRMIDGQRVPINPTTLVEQVQQPVARAADSPLMSTMNPMQLQPEPSPFPAAVAGAVYNALQAFNGRGGIQ